ncbi:MULTISPECIES: Lrp/AsnC family transcriptional regulator [Ruminococcus]|jgi:transcriptional regulator|uniref:Transcriptional regulators n=1 Tax=Ruminococcus champanellensis (strain DSM 18848 / JCM 17042 / KCTC 15320 / 18P13) TaxID=213810 RepID=D4LB39_RUMC1|nr:MULTISPECIES: Lrp/AsnC family transcriptional regulator [Ruminococcus]MED9892621.1 Lrp/AsnC family transcriptional regulator [Ruminococcus champanellensis]CBL16834.1 Transcriptional regulators [Ruminococcus champanellensis 18P13 = JCM 17042]CDD54080.1 transcriptional regulators [Ruminococcus sp. CAG:379]
MNELLHLLKQNARLSNEELGAMLGITPAEVAAQIKKLEEDGIIKGYSVVLNDELANKDTVTAFIELKVTPKRDCGFEDLAKTVMMYDEVESVSLMSGAYDLAVTVTGSSLKVIALFVAQRLSTIDGVLSTATHFVLKRYKEKGIFIEQEPIDERGMVSP